MKLSRLLLSSAPLAIMACAEGPSGPSGPSITIQTAPLTLPSIAGVEFALAVYNGQPTAGSVFDSAGVAAVQSGIDLVWNQSSVTSNQYGNGAGGDIAYVGPCDADSGTPGVGRDNYVVLALKQIDAGNGNGSVNGVAPFAGTNNVLGASDFTNPCPYDAPCIQKVLCQENADAAVQFNLTIMRSANQGFFDIAVNFEDIFCSAKYDSCTPGPVSCVTNGTYRPGNFNNAGDAQTNNFFNSYWWNLYTGPHDVYVYQHTDGTTVYAEWNATEGVWAVHSQNGSECNAGARLTNNSSGPTPPATLTISQSVSGWSPDGSDNYTVDLLNGTGLIAGPTTPIRLLHRPGESTRDWTGVAAVACTAGAGTGIDTELLLAQPQVVCNGATFDLPLDGQAEGNHNVTETNSASTICDGAPCVLHYALYFGDEDLACAGGSCNKSYYNIAFNLDQLKRDGLTSCVLQYYRASARDANAANSPIGANGQVSDANAQYPWIQFGASPPVLFLTGGPGSVPGCYAEPLNGAGSNVQSGYKYGANFIPPPPLNNIPFVFKTSGSGATAL